MIHTCMNGSLSGVVVFLVFLCRQQQQNSMVWRDLSLHSTYFNDFEIKSTCLAVFKYLVHFFNVLKNKQYIVLS